MDGNGWTEHARIVRVDTLMGEWRRGLQYIRDLILDRTLTPLTLEQTVTEGFLCGHVVCMGDFEPRPWDQSGVELEVYFDRDEVERIEKERPDVIAPPPPSAPSWPPPKAACSPSQPPTPTGQNPSSMTAEAHARIADLMRQLEEATRERDEARKKSDALAARVAEIEEKPLEQRERKSILAVLAALAYLPRREPQGPEERGLAKKIAVKSEEIKAPISDDTVKKWLSQAAELLK